MNQIAKAVLVSDSWLGRTFRVSIPEGEYIVDYSGRGWGFETIRVNGELEIKTKNTGWFTPIINFFLERHKAVIEVRVWPWWKFRSFHLLIDSKVLFCERRHGPRHSNEMTGSIGEANFGYVAELSASVDRLVCRFCGRRIRGVSFKVPKLPEAVLAKGPSIGIPFAEFSFSRRRQIKILIVGILFGIGTAFWTALLLSVPGFHSHGYSIAFLGIVATIFLPFYALKGPRPHAVAGTDGVALIDRQLVRAFRWEEIQEIVEAKWDAGVGHVATVRAVARGETHKFTILTGCGERFVFNNWLKDLDGLGRILYRETLPFLWPRALAAIAAGESLPFGPLVVTADGIAVSTTKNILWSDVRKAGIADQKLKIYKKRKSLVWFSAPMGEIPNLHVFKALVREFASDSEA